MPFQYKATLPIFADGNIHDNPQTNSSGVILTAPAAGTSGGAPSTGTASSVNDTNADTTVLAANANRKGASVMNDSTEILYLLVGSGTSSATNFSVKMAAGDFYELPLWQGGVYTGIIKGIWASDSTGAARVTEYT